jgi:hypothetical protein
MAVNSSHVTPAEGAKGGRWRVVVRYVVAEDGMDIRIPAGPRADLKWQVTEIRNQPATRIKAQPTRAELKLCSLSYETRYFREVFGRELFATLA